ncbi:TetR/AcrR family transcriptional regulator [Skermania sp. ID1734]|uniref:TetR/AcrR family transcriptional regulator n=1 Tax=Skermania sp. ID1734 TaxID=2597516 RepID=UPI00117E8CE8|nr:TetR/AcrR family transcriptional regulator [Skermania sp. ID1734]TSD99806.1 TetR/AcrR family transcriptional regulator [Skermania sp. ID1734]
MSNTAPRGGSQVLDGRMSRWDAHNAERREQILEAAIAAINDGDDAIGVKEIAVRAGVPRSVVYRIFADRDDLDEQLRARIVERLMVRLAPTLTPEGAVRESIARAVRTYLDWVVEYPKLHQFLGRGSRSRPNPASRVVTGTRTAIAVQLTGLLDAVLEKHSAPTTLAEPLAFGTIGLVNATVNRWLGNRNSVVTADQLADFLTESVWGLIELHARALGVELTPATTIAELS